MFVQQFFVKGLAHSSYLLAGAKTCAIVDPQRDVRIYLEAAKSLGMEITHILETHLHADFISGHLDLAEITGAPIYAPAAGSCQFDHVALSEGDTVEIEDLLLQVRETPGHTPEHLSYVVVDRAQGEEPVGVFCGDTLFVGDVGRPDLFPGLAEELAAKLWHSLHEKLLRLPDFCEVYPAHGAGSLCGRTMEAKRASTIGYERRYNAALQIQNQQEFIYSLTHHMPAAPDHFSRCSAINGRGPALMSSFPPLRPLSPAEVQDHLAGGQAAILDVRSPREFEASHIEGALNIPAPDLRTRYRELDPALPLAVLCSTGHRSSLAASLLKQRGFAEVYNVAGGLTGYSAAGFAPECPVCVVPHGPRFLGA